MHKFVSTIVAIAVVFTSTVYAKNICTNPCEGRPAGHMVEDCLKCPKYLECTGNGPNSFVKKTCSDPKACAKEVPQMCAQTCFQPNPPLDCYDDAVLDALGPAPGGGAPPLNLQIPVTRCTDPCAGRPAGHMVAGCVDCPEYLVCTGNGPNSFLKTSCSEPKACANEVKQRCVQTCFQPNPPLDCYDDAVLGGPPIADDAVDALILPQSAGTICPTGPAGIRSCHGKPDSDYQSCVSCNHYVSCSGGRMVGGQRPCAAKIVWDDNLKRCEWTSTTCTQP